MNLETLIDILARVDGRERQIIEAYVVRMRATRVISTRNDLNAMDVASAVVGLSAGRRAAEAPDAVQMFRSLEPHLNSGVDSEELLPDQVTEAEDFVEMIAAVIDTAPEIERAFQTIVRETLAHDPDALLGDGGEQEAMRLTVQMFSGAYSAGILRIETLLRRNWGYSKKQRNVDKVFEATWVDEDGPGMVDVQPAVRELSVVCRLPVFLELHRVLHAAAPTRREASDLFAALSLPLATR
jgi:hypothetical protein